MGARAIAAGCLLLALASGAAQTAAKKPAAASADATRAILVQKAHALEARGRPDMAEQLWQQILLSDPKNIEALEGMARDLKLTGSGQAGEALDRLRRASPNDPNIARIEALSSTKGESELLRRAGELARQGQQDEAMRIYRQLYGDRPPDGDIALAYYQTLAGTATGKAEAVAAMRALAARNPGDPRYAIELGVMLTFDERTRAEGIRLLRAHPKDSHAMQALRQALIWDSANPASAAELRAYLKEHPQDAEMAVHLKEEESKLAQMNSGIARTPEEREAFAALNAHKLDEAEKRFTALLEKDPQNGRVAAGMGFVRMQQKNFGGALSYLTQAEQDGYKAAVVENALAASRFYYTMSEATQAFADNQPGLAQAKYRAALEMRPHDPDALMGLAGLLVREGAYAAAAALYEDLVRVQPLSSDAWRGLFLSYARDHRTPKAAAVPGRLPAPVRASLSRDPEYLRTLADVYSAEDRPGDAQRVLAEALSLPFPGNGSTLKIDTRMQYAGLLMQAKHFDRAAALYAQILAEDQGNLAAWMGLIAAHHELGQDSVAVSDVGRMPAATYEMALSDASFLSLLGGMYQGANQLEVAQGLLERSVKLQLAAGRTPGVDLQLQLAGVYLLRNDTDRAYGIYTQVLAKYPQRADAWKGLIATLLLTNRSADALNAIAQIPAPLRQELDKDIEFVESEASLYAASGDTARAMEYMNLVRAHYARLKIDPPANIQIQNAWLLYNTRNDRLLYPTLMHLGGRADLSDAQRETVQNIWANWSVRRASIALENGNTQRAVDILDAASLAFPNNIAVRKAVAGGYEQVGRVKESLALYKSVEFQDASAGDYQGAIGAALAANDRTQAEIWLRQALERFPRDPAILSLAARYEQLRGENERAADYYRAALAAMPQVSPTQRLAHELVYPEQDTRPKKAVTAADLQHLLDPNNEPFAKTNKLAPLPAYGPDPESGAPLFLPAGPPASMPDGAPQRLSQPVPRSPGQTGQPEVPPDSDPPSNQAPPQTAPASSPAVWNTPQQRGPGGPQLFERQSFKRGAGKSRAGDAARRVASIQIRPTPRLRRLPMKYRFLRAAWREGRDTAPIRGSHSLNRGRFAYASLAASAASASAAQDGPITANPPHSLASDAWKGLIFSLMSAHREAEALQELNKMPAEIRRQLEADVEFEQGEAGLYAAVGDTAHATEYLNRVENFYLLHRGAAPAGLEVQHAWMLYNLGDDAGLYPVLVRLDARPDLSAAQREQIDNLWANWAVRRARTALDAGNFARGMQLLQAASEQYPGNLSVRHAIAGAYAKVGRYADALALFKSIPMDNATPGDYDAAVGAALGATDMVQAEAWLRQALQRFPGDPGVLALSARFEQARGNAQRAADFWRAALAAMPPGAAVTRLDAGTVPQGAYTALPAGALKPMLDPRNDTRYNSPQPGNAVPLPSWRDDAPSPAHGSVPALPAAAPQAGQWLNSPSSAPLPLPAAGQSAHPAEFPAGPQASPAQQAPVYVPQSSLKNKPLATPVLVQQKSANEAAIRPAANPAGQTQSKPGSARDSSPAYMGRMNLPPSEQTILTTEPEAAPAAGGAPGQPPNQAHAPATGSLSQSPPPAVGLRIASQPMNDTAAQVQALMAEQTDAQLTRGSASSIHSDANSSGLAASIATTAPSGQGSQYNVAQYTPSAQEAASGAYSAPRQQTPASAAAPQCAPQIQCPAPAKPPAKTGKKKKPAPARAAPAAQSPPANTQTLGSAPAQELPPPPAPASPASAEYPQQLPAPAATPPAAGTGLSDEELQQRNLPPLRGPWVRVQRENRPLSPRDEAEMQLRSIEAGYSAWLGVSGVVNYRSGAFGYDHLAALEAPFEASTPLGLNARLTIVARPVFLDSGQADGTSTLTVLESTTSGSALVAIPQPIGTLTATNTTLPAQQNAAGVGGEVQLAFPHLAIAGGYTPWNFLVSTFTARANWKPANGPFTFSFNRDSVKDTQLSYAGLRDPAGTTLGTLGQIWGGVMANQGNAQYARGDAESGIYLSAGGQYLAGYQVQTNIRIEGSGGGYWHIRTAPEYGALSIGANFFGMHYQHNQDAFTHGMGGYFSPQAYFLANVPFTWVGHYGPRWHYDLLGSLGVQAFQENQTPLWPLAVDKALETAQSNAMLPAKTSVGPNYDLRTHVAYAIGPHWFAGGFLSANNSRNYNAVSAGFFIRYMFRPQPATAAGPTGIFPTDGLRPFTVP